MWRRGVRDPVHMHCDIKEDDCCYYIRAELAGVCKEDLKLEIVGNILKLAARKKTWLDTYEEGKETEHQPVSRLGECAYGHVERSFRLPSSVDTDSAETKFEDGVLCLHFKKTGAGGVKRLTIA